MSIHFKEIAAMAHALGLNAYPNRCKSRRRSIPVEHYRNGYSCADDGGEWQPLADLGLIEFGKQGPGYRRWWVTPKGIELVERYMLTAPRDRETELRRIQAEFEEGAK